MPTIVDNLKKKKIFILQRDWAEILFVRHRKETAKERLPTKKPTKEIKKFQSFSGAINVTSQREHLPLFKRFLKDTIIYIVS